MITNLNYPQKNAMWPAFSEQQRAFRIRDNGWLYKGEFFRLWPEAVLNDDEFRGNKSVKQNWFNIATNFWSRLMFGTPPVISGDVNPVMGASITSLGSHGTIDLLRSGNAVILIRKSPMDDYRISRVPPQYWFPVHDEIDQSIIQGHLIGFPYKTTETDAIPDRIAIYTILPNRLTTRKIFRYDGQTLGNLLNVEVMPDQWSVVSIANGDQDGLYGEDLYNNPSDAIRELAERQLGLSKVMDKHSNPHLYGDERMLDDGGKIGYNKEGMFLPVASDDGVIPGYVVWDPQLLGQNNWLVHLKQSILNSFDLPESVFSASQSGQAEAGTSLTLRTVAMNVRIEQLRRLWESGLNEMFYIMDGSYREFTWPLPGLPNTLEQAQTEEVRINSGTTDPAAARSRLDRN